MLYTYCYHYQHTQTHAKTYTETHKDINRDTDSQLHLADQLNTLHLSATSSRQIQLTSTDVWVRNRATRVLVKEGLALFAVVTHRVVLAVVTDTATDTAGRLVDGGIEVTSRGMLVTLAHCNL